MSYSPYILFDVDLDRRLVHLVNALLALPLLLAVGLVRRTLKARILPFLDANVEYKDGRHHSVHLTRGIEAALCYNHNPAGVDTVDVLAVYRSPASEVQIAAEHVLFDHLKIRDHRHRRPEPTIKHHLSYAHYIRRLSQHLELVGSFVDEYGSEQHKSEFDRIDDAFSRNVAKSVVGEDAAATEDTIHHIHALLLKTAPDLRM